MSIKTKTHHVINALNILLNDINNCGVCPTHQVERWIEGHRDELQVDLDIMEKIESEKVAASHLAAKETFAARLAAKETIAERNV